VPAAHAAASSGWDWHTLVTRLNAWVPSGKREMGEYLPMVREMLDGTAHTLADRRLPPEQFDVYRNLVVTTAWQESCWRQYVKKAGQVQPIRGPGGVGLMQINTRVCAARDAKGIAADIGYNGRAGAEILYHCTGARSRQGTHEPGRRGQPRRSPDHLQQWAPVSHTARRRPRHPPPVDREFGRSTRPSTAATEGVLLVRREGLTASPRTSGRAAHDLATISSTCATRRGALAVLEHVGRSRQFATPARACGSRRDRARSYSAARCS
jgi:hypothetical protein